MELAEEERQDIADRPKRIARGTATLAEHLAEEDVSEVPARDPIIPDRLYRRDRLILTGFEGAGKSTLLDQIAMMIASGMDPFTGERTCVLQSGEVQEQCRASP